MAKMWAGRFKKELNKEVNDFNSSLHFDNRMYEMDIIGSIAHAKMLGKQGIISKEDSDLIIENLTNISEDITEGKLIFNDAEDIHMFVEEELTKRIGPVGKRLHTSRSRNDQVALDVRLYLREEIKTLIALVKTLIAEVIELSSENTKTIMPGYTHLQRAQPITFANHLLAYGFMFKRDLIRLEETYKHTNMMPLGSCALAGTTYNIDRDYVSELLNFTAPTENSLDGVSDRDFCLDLVSNLSTIMMHLSRFSEEIILWSSFEFKFIDLDDAYSTGSSIMPQKKNPDIAELVRGKTGRVYGDLMALYTVLKGLPLAYNKDMQEDKEATFDAIDTVKQCLSVFTPMLATINVNKDKMRNAAAKGFINATDLADYLVKKGMPFRDAYKISGTLVAYCIDNDTVLEDVSLEVYKEFSELFESDLYDAISLENATFRRSSKGASSVESVLQQIKALKEVI